MVVNAKNFPRKKNKKEEYQKEKYIPDEKFSDVSWCQKKHVQAK